MDKYYKKVKVEKSQFDYLKQMGEGSFGSVFKVMFKPNRKLYALKILEHKKIRDQNLGKQLLNEIRILSQCRHPNVIRLHHIFQDSKHIFMLMELGQKSLFDLIKENKKLSEQQTAHLMRDIIRAVVYLHSRDPQILHRDIKPENILVVAGNLKIADFGWANRQGDYRNTFCGTPDYFAPEMIEGNGHDEKLDV